MSMGCYYHINNHDVKFEVEKRINSINNPYLVVGMATPTENLSLFLREDQLVGLKVAIENFLREDKLNEQTKIQSVNEG